MSWRVWTLLAVVLAATAIAEYRYDPEAFPGFYFLFGLAGCVVMLVATKGVAMKFLTRKEDYYDRS